VTERNRSRAELVLAREQLSSSEYRYRLLFERNPQPMVAYDRQTLQIVAVSNAMVANYGHAREEFVTMRIHDLVPPEDVDGFLSYLATGPSGASSTQGRGGTIIDVEVTSDNLALDGRECRIALYHDVTERNKAVAELAIARDQAVEASRR
jgi:PAS domain S-box-containing protein